MKKEFRKNAITLTISLVLIISIQVVSAAWSEPGSAAPAGNIAAPVHEGTLNQLKDSGLTVDGATGLIVWQNAAIAQKTVIKGPIRGAVGSPETVYFGGTDASNIKYLVDLFINGKTSAVGTLTDTDIVDPASGNICADATGTLELCTAAGGGAGGGCPPGQVVDYTGHCNYTVQVTSPYPGMTITAVTGIPGFVYNTASPVGNIQAGYAGRQEGTHTDFTGVIKVTIGAPTQLDGNLYLYRSGYPVDCFNIKVGSAGGTATFPAQRYVSSSTSGDDVISISGASSLGASCKTL